MVSNAQAILDFDQQNGAPGLPTACANTSHQQGDEARTPVTTEASGPREQAGPDEVSSEPHAS